ncbi:MAG: hypothetical protein PHW04_11920 [Candidatus Wallbacteria bacterium]|nr:hypothetical protein [Candidatus Wallbacteria bacterium]
MYRHPRLGLSMLIVILAILTLLALTGLSIDLGDVWLARSRLNLAAGKAALAAATVMGKTAEVSVPEAAMAEFRKNNLEPEHGLSVSISKGSDNVFINANLLLPHRIGSLLGIPPLNLSAKSLAEFTAVGEARLIRENSYRLLPFGIPNGLVTVGYDSEETLYIDGKPASSWVEDPAFRFKPGHEYLLKIGEGAPVEPEGSKLLIPMDGALDVNPQDFSDPVCPELGSHMQPEPLLAYGFVSWCLERGYQVEWLIDYNGGSFLVDYHAEIAAAMSQTGVSYKQVAKILLSSKADSQLHEFLATHNNSEGRPYSIIALKKSLKAGIFMHSQYKQADLMPWGVKKQVPEYPYGFQIGSRYQLKYGGATPEIGCGCWCGLSISGSPAACRENVQNGNSTLEATCLAGITATTELELQSPVMLGLEHRLRNGRTFFRIPVLSTCEVKSRKKTSVLGFLNFNLTAVDVKKGVISGTFLSKIPWDKLDCSRLENTKEIVAAKLLSSIGIPFVWLHDRDVLSGSLPESWIFVNPGEFSDTRVAAALARWDSNGHQLFLMGAAGPSLDYALCEFNRENGTGIVPPVFFKTSDTSQIYAGNDTAGTCEIRPRDCVENQNHVLTLGPVVSRRPAAFSVSSLLFSQEIFARDNPGTGYREGISASRGLNLAELATRRYSLDSGPGGLVTICGGLDFQDVPAARILLNDLFSAAMAGSQKNPGRTNFGALAPFSEKEMKARGYADNIKMGCKRLPYPVAQVGLLSGNHALETCSGIAYLTKTNENWKNPVRDSSRIVLVPVVKTDIPGGPSCIYTMPEGSVKIKAIAKFWLLNVTEMLPAELDNSLGPVQNGQVRGVFMGYFIPPVD